jgi:plastocyanin
MCTIGLAALVLAACGEDRKGSVAESGGSTTTSGAETGTTPDPGGPMVARVSVKESEYELAPKDVRVAKAGVVSIQVQNTGTIIHALEVEGPKGEVKTGAVHPHMSAPLKVDLSSPGTYEWYCPIGDHRARGMKGKITVAGGGSGASKDDSGKGGGSSGKSAAGKSGDDSGKSGGSGKSGSGSGKPREDPGKPSGAGGGGSGVY